MAIETMSKDLKVINASVEDYLEKLDKRVHFSEEDILNRKEELISNKNSFVIFTMIIGKTVQKLVQANEMHQINKLIGRIFVKFSGPKLFNLFESGLHNLIELFLICAIASEEPDIITKFRDKLLLANLTQVKTTKQLSIVRGHIAFMILSCRHMLNISDYLKKFMEQFNKVIDSTDICRLLASGLGDIFHENLHLDLGRSVLIGE